MHIRQSGVIVTTAYSTCTTNNINMPVILKYYISPTFSFDLGTQVGLNVCSNMKIQSGDLGDAKNYTKNFYFGIGLGDTYNLSDKAFIQAHYTMVLTMVFKQDELGNSAQNGNIQLAFGLKF